MEPKVTAADSIGANDASRPVQRPVTVRVLGGLGNQMFQYATARAIAERSGAEVLLDLRGFDSYQLRKPALDRWRIKAQVATAHDLKRFSERGLWWSRRLAPLGIASRCYNEAKLSFDPALLRRQPPQYLSGYFQSEKYFADIRAVLLNEFVPVRSLSADNQRLAREATATNSIAIHVRRGDYVSDARNVGMHGICEIAYYDKAIELLRAQTGPATYFVFSDDMGWTRRNLNLPGPVFHVEGNQDDPEVDIHLMSLCRHNVCANSSFSWWGAWLNRHPSKLVVAPTRWFASNKLDASDLVPSDWIRLD